MTSQSSQTATDIDLAAELAPQKLIDLAIAETGLSNFYPGAIDSFNRLVQSAINEVEFAPIGLMAFKAHMHRLLVNHLRIEEELRQHPEILEQDVSDPIVILGMPRTGTTKLQRMMSADPHVHKFFFWRLFNPARFPGANPSGPDPRIEAAHQTAKMLETMYPHFMAVHPTLAEEVDEDLFLMEFSFKTQLMAARFGLHSYNEWIVKTGMYKNYPYLARIFKYLQWQDGGKKGQPWIMKSPFHSGSLDALLETFPKATLVHNHRALDEVIPSFCNMMDACLHLYTDKVDLQEVGRFYLEIVSTDMKRYLKLREELKSRVDIYDLAYTKLMNDPMAAISEIYQRAGRPLGEDSRQAMTKWNTEYPKDRFGKNVYTMETYGLTHARIEGAFKDYIAQFGPYLAKKSA